MASWKNYELVSGKPGLAKSIVLPTCGCYYDSCYMCSYKRDCPPRTPPDIVNMFESELEEGIDKYKVFTSGSFFDEREMSREQQTGILRAASESGARELTVESRPELIDETFIKSCLHMMGDGMSLEVAIGLESANDDVLRYHINKGFTYEKYAEKAALLHDNGALVKAYLLLKPPLLTEYESILDVVESARKVEETADTISINPVSIHRGSVVEQLWMRRRYRPPYLWSLAECLNQIRDLGPYVMTHPVAVGKERGIHNCGSCERELMERIEEYNMGSRGLIDCDCECKREWEEELKKIF